MRTRRFTESQWFWLENCRTENSNLFGRICAFLAMIVIVAFTAWSLFFTENKTAEISQVFVLLLSIAECFWLVIGMIIVWVSVVAFQMHLQESKGDDKNSPTCMDLTQSFSRLIPPRNGRFLHYVNRTIPIILENAFIIMLIIHGWRIWGSILLCLNIVSEVGIFALIIAMSDNLKKTDPEILRIYSELTNIHKEMMKDVPKDIKKLLIEKNKKFITGNPIIYEILCEVKTAPHVEYSLSINGCDIRLKKNKYKHENNQEIVNLNDPQSFETISSQLTKSIRESIEEAEE